MQHINYNIIYVSLCQSLFMLLTEMGRMKGAEKNGFILCEEKLYFHKSSNYSNNEDTSRYNSQAGICWFCVGWLRMSWWGTYNIRIHSNTDWTPFMPFSEMIRNRMSLLLCLLRKMTRLFAFQFLKKDFTTRTIVKQCEKERICLTETLVLCLVCPIYHF